MTRCKHDMIPEYCANCRMDSGDKQTISIIKALTPKIIRFKSIPTEVTSLINSKSPRKEVA